MVKGMAQQGGKTVGDAGAAPTVVAPWADLVIGVAAMSLLGWGWATRYDPRYDPSGWTGYWIGLGGTLAMVAVLGFSWAKRRPSGRISVPAWYRVHLVLGVFGPVAVLVHARFGWRAINSGVALAAMLLVVGSGLVARYALGPARRSRFAPARRVAELWHYLHVPLGLVLVMAVIAHVYMVHAY